MFVVFKHATRHLFTKPARGKGMVRPQMIYPETDELSQYPRYVLALLTARRAQMLRAGEKPLVVADSDNLLSIALEEIAQGKIRPRVLSPEEVEVEIVDQTKLSDFEIAEQPALNYDEAELPTTLQDLPVSELHDGLDILASEEDEIPDIPEADDLTDEEVAKLSDMLARQEALVSEELKKEKEEKSMNLAALLSDLPDDEEEVLEDIETEEDASLAENG